ncbi:DUF6445 family protein [Geothrix sp. PMB-07]|uniref:DUF6445 family protein n=1 Tax=Geothrix sp. PMB-07 TaxID=3068640 RepID=UPI0027411A1A|nr:DUF6445 family protein [Geothrix sp. PMB-07]WLT33194.1 DUF6445 family protein [Geothrix sp. PMB-07]
MPLPGAAARPPTLPYRRPQEGRDYWVVDGILPDAEALAARLRSRHEWELGFPHTRETWPGMRSRQALTLEELTPLEAKVRELTGAKRLWAETAPDGAYLNHNVVQVVGARESGPRPHTDSRKLCRYAAVIYLTPRPPGATGTTFYRLRYPNGTLGGNLCAPPHTNLREALGVAGLPLQAWHPELSIPNVFNRLLLYRADLVHSATGYFGHDLLTKRMTALFFWMAE